VPSGKGPTLNTLLGAQWKIPNAHHLETLELPVISSGWSPIRLYWHPVPHMKPPTPHMKHPAP